MSRNNSAGDSSDRTSSPTQRRETASPGDERVSLTFADFLRILGRQGAQISLLNNDDDDEDASDDDDDDDRMGSYDVPRFVPPFSPHDEPQEVGTELLKGGEFGSVAVKIRDRRNDRNISRSLRTRLDRPGAFHRRENITSNLVPNSNGVTIANYLSNVYTAQFSDDSSFFYTCDQDFKLHIYDVKAPPVESSADQRSMTRTWNTNTMSTMSMRKVIQGPAGRWTITDANVSPDNERIIYSSLIPTVYMTNISQDGNSSQIPIHFGDSSRNRYYDSFGIYSCRFSADGKEVIAGSNGTLFVYDLVANRRTVKITAHDEDVNSCCWADTASGNVLVSASDDCLLKVWDRRSLGASRKPSGVLIGHTEGLTYVSAKGDGRYIISNGKDQALRLWDLRRMASGVDLASVDECRIPRYDYRSGRYPRPKMSAHPDDCSVMTYRGHSVLRTLIRCHFSPMETTGAQYIYSGSADGRIHIWSLDGTIVNVLDCAKTLPMGYPLSGPEPPHMEGTSRFGNRCVRDLSWHSQEPVIISAGWNDFDGGSALARHEFKGLSKMGGALADWVEKQRVEDEERNGHRQRGVVEKLRGSRTTPLHVHGSTEEA